MPGKGCSSKRKHTPITSEKQRGLFGAEYARRKAGKEPRMPGITKTELKSHLKESKGKDLPHKVRVEQYSRKVGGKYKTITRRK